MMTLEETLDALYRDMEEHGNRVQYFSPYIPLVITGTGTNLAPPGMVAYAGGWADAESVAYAEKVNASGERNVWTSDLIRSLGGLVEILDDIKDVGVRQR